MNATKSDRTQTPLTGGHFVAHIVTDGEHHTGDAGEQDEDLEPFLELGKDLPCIVELPPGRR